MLRVMCWRSVRRGHFGFSPSICSPRQIASNAVKRRYSGRQRPLPRAPKRWKASYPGPVSSPLTKFTLQPMYHVGDFSFDPFPPMLFTAQHASLDTADDYTNSARHRNKERGTELILKYGCAERASAALEAAYSQLRAQLERHQSHQSVRSSSISALHQISDLTRQIPGLKLSLAQQVVGIREAAVEEAKGVEKALGLKFLEQESAWARQLAQMYPFLVLFRLQSKLFRFIRSTRIASVRRLGAEGFALYDEQTKLFDNLVRQKQSTAVHMNTFEQQYEEIKDSSYERLHHLHATNRTLYTQIQSTTTSNTPQGMHRSTMRALRTFVPVLYSMQELIEQSEKELFTIELRRKSLRYGARQYIYSALHHDFKTTRSLAKQFLRQTDRHFARLVVQAKTFHRDTRTPEPSLLRNRWALLEALAEVNRGMQEIMNIYHREFLPLWALRVASMSSSELIRQGRVAREYWPHCFRSNQGHVSRVTELTEISDVLQAARHCSRTGARVHKKYGGKDILKKRASAAIARLSEIYRQQYQGVVESDTQERHNIQAGEATMPVGKPTISTTRNTVLWQPHRFSTHENRLGRQPQEVAKLTAESLDGASLHGVKPNLGSEAAVPSTRKTVLWRPYRSTSNQGNPRDMKDVGSLHSSFTASQGAQQVPPAHRNIWHGIYSAERLAERYPTLESAMEVVDRRYEAEKRRIWDLRASLGRNQWQHCFALLETDLGISDYLVAYHQHRIDVYKAICMKTLDMTKGIVVANLARHTALVSLMHQMRPLREQLVYLRWLYFILLSSPHQKLKTHSHEFQMAWSDMEPLINKLYQLRRIERLSTHERRYEVTKYISVRPFEELQSASKALWALNEDYLDSPNSHRFQMPHRIMTANVALRIFQRDTNLAVQDLHLIRMSRNGLLHGPKQNVYHSLYHHVKDLRASTRGIVGFIQRQYLALVRNAIGQKHIVGSWTPIREHEAEVASLLMELDHLNQMMVDIFYDHFLPLWSRRLDTMSSAELARHDRVARVYWSSRMRSDGVVKSLEVARTLERLGRELKFYHKSDTRVRELRRTGTKITPNDLRLHMLYRKKAAAAMERLEQIFPSQRPKSAQNIRAILGTDSRSSSMLEVKRVPAAEQILRARVERRIQSASVGETVARKTRRPLQRAHPSLESPPVRDSHEQPRASRPPSSAKRLKSMPHPSHPKPPSRTSRIDLRNDGPKSQVKTSAAVSQSGKSISRKKQWAQDQANGLRGLNVYPLGPFH